MVSPSPGYLEPRPASNWLAAVEYSPITPRRRLAPLWPPDLDGVLTPPRPPWQPTRLRPSAQSPPRSAFFQPHPIQVASWNDTTYRLSSLHGPNPLPTPSTTVSRPSRPPGFSSYLLAESSSAAVSPLAEALSARIPTAIIYLTRHPTMARDLHLPGWMLHHGTIDATYPHRPSPRRLLVLFWAQG